MRRLVVCSIEVALFASPAGAQVGGQPVDLVEGHDAWLLRGAQLVEDRLDDGGLVRDVGDHRELVDDVREAVALRGPATDRVHRAAEERDDAG